MATFTTKLGNTRAGEHSRIWIEGQRLTDAGFVRGAKFEKDFDPTTRTLYLTIITDAQFARNPISECGWKGVLIGTVSGKDQHPIIDIVGKKVMETFRFCSHVSVAYEAGCITITPATEG